jgi:hypothetical protein
MSPKTNSDYRDSAKDKLFRDAFNMIVKVSNTIWARIYKETPIFQARGHLVAWGECSLMVLLNYHPKKSRLYLSTTVADNARERPSLLDDILWAVNADHGKGKVVYNAHDRIFAAKACGDCWPDGTVIPDCVQALFEDFRLVINDERLRTAIALSQAQLLGTRINFMENDCEEEEEEKEEKYDE